VIEWFGKSVKEKLMPVRLTDEQRQALAAQPLVPLRVIDPQTNETYVLLKLDQYERVKAVLEGEDFDVREAYPLMDEVARKEGWDDPDLDLYNDLVPRQQL
jgi:hypothetical protein